MKWNRILLGDCRETLRKLPKKSVHAVVTSPPYFDQRDYEIDGQIGLGDENKFIEELIGVFAEVHRVLRDDGTLWVNIADTFRKKQMMGIPWKMTFAMIEWGWRACQEVIWHKSNPMMAPYARPRCTLAHESIFMFSKKGHYFYDSYGVREKSEDKQERIIDEHLEATWKQGKVGKHHTGRIVSGKMSYGAPGGLRKRHSVWKFGTQGFKGAHFATFPETLPRLCILQSTSDHGVCADCGTPWMRKIKTKRIPTRPGTNTKIENKEGKVIGHRDPERHITEIRALGWEQQCQCDTTELKQAIVLDPFSGAGTTLLAAKKLHRRWIGCELNPEYLAMATARIDRAHSGFMGV